MSPTARTVLITGASGSVGGEIAKALASVSSKMVLSYKENHAAAKALSQTLGDLGCDVTLIPCDLSTTQGANYLATEALRALGRVEILINSAGRAPPLALVEDLHIDQFNTTLGLNLTTPFLLCKAVLPEMKTGNWGRIVNISSIHSRVTPIQRSPYSISKAGLEALTKTIAKEAGPFGITSNIISPGPVGGRSLEESWAVRAAQESLTPEEFERIALDFIPSRRLARADEIGQIVRFLCTDEAAYLTGQNIEVAGGLTTMPFWERLG